MWPKNDNTLQQFFAGAILSALSVHVSGCLTRICIKSTVCRVWYEHMYNMTPIFFGFSQEFESNLPSVEFGNKKEVINVEYAFSVT
jgi:hypothetical protein